MCIRDSPDIAALEPVAKLKQKLASSLVAPQTPASAFQTGNANDSLIQLTSNSKVISPMESAAIDEGSEFLIGNDLVERRAATSMVPPSALVSQPLEPILFDAHTRAIQVAAENSQTANSLRRNEKWSHEKPVDVTDRTPAPSMTVWNQAEIETGPIPLNHESEIEFEPNRITNTGFARVSFESCPTCLSAKCDGNCKSRTRRNELAQPKPMIDSNPIVIVATTTKDTIPPFADLSLIHI